MLDLLLVAVVFFVLGLCAGIILLARTIKKTLEDKEEAESFQEIVDDLTGKLVFLKVEQESNLFFAYDALSGDFVCQGTSMEDLSTNFGLRYPTKKGILVEPEKGEARELV